MRARIIFFDQYKPTSQISHPIINPLIAVKLLSPDPGLSGRHDTVIIGLLDTKIEPSISFDVEF